MVTLTKTPDKIAYSKVPIFTTLKTDQITQVKASVLFAFTEPGPSDGDTVILTWLTKSVVFTFKTSPSALTDIAVWDGTGAFADWLDLTFRAALEANQVVADDWIPSVSGNNLVLDYRRQAAVAPVVTGSCSNLVSTPTVSIGAYLKPNLGAYLKIYRNDGSLEGIAMRSPYNIVDSKTTIDLSPVFSDLKPTLPSSGGHFYFYDYANPAIAQDSFMSYYFRYAEQSGAPVATDALQISAQYLAIYGGGAGAGTYVDLNNTVDILVESFVTLLHNYPASYRKQITPVQLDWAYVVAKKTLTNCFIEVHVYLDDGSTLVWVVNPTYFTLQKNTVYFFPTGMGQLGLNNKAHIPTDRRVTAFDWQLRHDNRNDAVVFGAYTTLARVRYEVDTKCDVNDMYLLLDNGLGGMESLRLYGNRIEKYEAEQVVTERARWTDFTPELGQVDSVNRRGQILYECTTGLLPTAYAKQLRQLMLGNIWIIDIDKLRLLKAVRDSKSIDIRPSLSFQSMSFNFRTAWFDDNYVV